MKQAARGGPERSATIVGEGATRRIEMPVLAAVPGLAHLFTAKGADPRSAIADAAGRDLPITSLRQVHGASVRVAGSVIRGEGPREEGDALIAAAPGVAVGVWVADCLPILICDPTTRAIAAVHAGWRGTVAGVLRAAIGGLQSRFGARPQSLLVAMGPAIGPCCFEVGDEVAKALLAAFPDAGPAVIDGPGAKQRIDLVTANRIQALGAGLDDGRIQGSGLCTRCRPDLLESYRRDGAAAGRMAAVIAWRE